MAYDIKQVFYLDFQATIASGTAGMTSAQLDLSAYIDPIARGRTKGTGLAIYKCHFDIAASTSGGEAVLASEAGVLRGGIVAGAGLGNSATGVATADRAQQPSASNALAIHGFDWYGPKSTIANASTPGGFGRTIYLEPSEKVPYVVVRDNVCMVLEQAANMTVNTTVSYRLECAQITLDQATLNQLLRTQTV